MQEFEEISTTFLKIAEKHQSEAAMLKTQLAEAKKNADEKDSIIAAYELGMECHG